MASKAIMEQKVQQVEEIKKMITSASSVVLIDYCGISVAQDTELRNEFRKNDVKYAVIKNRLLKLAFNELGYNQFDEALNGPIRGVQEDEDQVRYGRRYIPRRSRLQETRVAAVQRRAHRSGSRNVASAHRRIRKSYRRYCEEARG